ncbi:extensin [Rhizobiales bacterium RZME27]|uniref:Extensin n=1 Tax=Endobacterium cereale TaxID=2663029 RepID=A0A6A8AI11_9HYPH|nr:extensin family protein [Endobacterium cereale]MEB2843878.1 extensin family protein [Endobacterium cereale]MQY49488.1 extensin [Endobacterium cereale]
MAYALFWRRLTASLMITTMLTACSAEGLVPPAGIDNGTRVGAIRPMPPANMPANQTYGGTSTSTAGLSNPMPPASVDQSQSSYGYLREPGVNGNPGSSYGGYGGQNAGIAQQPMPPATGNEQWGGPMPPEPSGQPVRNARVQQGRLPGIDSDEGVAAVSRGQGMSNGMSAQGADGGVNMDSELGVGGNNGVVGLAEEQQTDIAEGVGNQPVVDGIGSDSPRALGRRGGGQNLADEPVIVPPKRSGSGQRADRGGDINGEQPWQRQSTPFGTRQVGGAARTEEVAMLRTPNPMDERAPIAPPRGPEAMPASEASCRVELRRLGVEFRNAERISDGPSCGIDYPVELTGLSGDIDVKPSVKLNCQTTLAFARWVKYELAPSSRYRYWSGVKRIVPLGGYSCRRMNNSRQKYNPMSEHSRGNAIDVGKFVLKNGKDIDVRKKGLFSFREGALLKAVRTDSCKYFNTVLGPGSNKEHWNHFHFDLRQRKSSSRYCD